jgi:hypothetical protein
VLLECHDTLKDEPPLVSAELVLVERLLAFTVTVRNDPAPAGRRHRCQRPFAVMASPTV